MQQKYSKTSHWLYGLAGWVLGIFVANLFLVYFMLPRNNSQISDFWVIAFFSILFGLGGSDFGRKLYLRKLNGQGILIRKQLIGASMVHIYQCGKCDSFQRVGSDEDKPSNQFCERCKGNPMILVESKRSDQR